MTLFSNHTIRLFKLTKLFKVYSFFLSPKTQKSQTTRIFIERGFNIKSGVKDMFSYKYFFSS